MGHRNLAANLEDSEWTEGGRLDVTCLDKLKVADIGILFPFSRWLWTD